ncbi:peroxisome bioproteinsis factor 10, partial [Perkinsus olseni]
MASSSLKQQSRSLVLLEDLKNRQVAEGRLSSLLQDCMPARRVTVRSGSRRQVQFRQLSPAVVGLVATMVVYLAAARRGHTIGEEYSETLSLKKRNGRLGALGATDRMKQLMLQVVLPFFVTRPKIAKSFLDFVFSGRYPKIGGVEKFSGDLCSLAPLVYKLNLACFYAGCGRRYLSDQILGISRVSLSSTTTAAAGGRESYEDGGIFYPSLALITIGTVLLEVYGKWWKGRNLGEADVSKVGVCCGDAVDGVYFVTVEVKAYLCRMFTAKVGRIFCSDPSASNEEWEESLDAGGEFDLQYDRLTCLICYSEMQSPAALVCGHMFCWRCATEWLEERSSSLEGSRGCPLCRRACEPQQVVPVFHFAPSPSAAKEKRRESFWSLLPW